MNYLLALCAFSVMSYKINLQVLLIKPEIKWLLVTIEVYRCKSRSFKAMNLIMNTYNIAENLHL